MRECIEVEDQPFKIIAEALNTPQGPWLKPFGQPSCLGLAHLFVRAAQTATIEKRPPVMDELPIQNRNVKLCLIATKSEWQSNRTLPFRDVLTEWRPYWPCRTQRIGNVLVMKIPSFFVIIKHALSFFLTSGPGLRGAGMCQKRREKGQNVYMAAQDHPIVMRRPIGMHVQRFPGFTKTGQVIRGLPFGQVGN